MLSIFNKYCHTFETMIYPVKILSDNRKKSWAGHWAFSFNDVIVFHLGKEFDNSVKSIIGADIDYTKEENKIILKHYHIVDEGNTSLNETNIEKEADKIISNMKTRYSGTGYNASVNNCQTFAVGLFNAATGRNLVVSESGNQGSRSVVGDTIFAITDKRGTRGTFCSITVVILFLLVTIAVLLYTIYAYRQVSNKISLYDVLLLKKKEKV